MSSLGWRGREYKAYILDKLVVTFVGLGDGLRPSFCRYAWRMQDKAVVGAVNHRLRRTELFP